MCTEFAHHLAGALPRYVCCNDPGRVEVVTYSTVAITLGLAVARPRITPRFRVSPAMAAFAGVLVLALTGSVRLHDVTWAASTMWRPLLGIVAIMLMTGVARSLGVLDTVATFVFEGAEASPRRLFTRVFVFGALTAAVLNNDSAIMLVTPLVLDAAKKRTPKLVVPLAFAVFLSAGVAPFIVSNPMNMVVATYSGIGFNEYARHMIMPAAACALVTWAMTSLAFRREMDAASRSLSYAQIASVTSESERVRFSSTQRLVLGALALVVLSYPVVSWLGGPVWAVAAVGAVVMLGIAMRAKVSPLTLARTEVHYDTLFFLVAALLLSVGLRNVGIVEHLARMYDGASNGKIGAISAVGSALLNNHPMSHLNMFALNAHGTGGGLHAGVLAALIGGDLGPRLFPIGSLAGLLWIEMLRRAGVETSVKRFLIIGAITIPAIAISIALL